MDALRTGIISLAIFLFTFAFTIFPPDCISRTTVDNDQSRSLFEAASKGDVDGVMKALDTVPVDTVSETGVTALFLASQMGQDDIVKVLLETGASPNKIFISGKTALLQAASFNHQAIVDLLLDAGADPNVADNEGFTPLMAACSEGRTSIVRRLIEADAETSKLDNTGMSALHYSAQFGTKEVVEMILNADGLLKKIMGGNIDINARTYNGHTPLMLAFDRWNYHTVNLLIERGADLNDYALRIAAMNNETDKAGLLLKKGSKINAYGRSFIKGEVPTTALLAAAMQGHEKMVNLLISKGAKDTDGVANLLGMFELAASHYQPGKVITKTDLMLMEAKLGSEARAIYLGVSSEGEHRIIEAMASPQKQKKYDRIFSILKQGN